MQPRRESRVGRAAAAVEGVDPSGEPLVARLDEPTVLVFLTGSCRPCQVYWREGAGLSQGLGSGAVSSVSASVVFVTPDPSTEDRRRVARLAAGAAPIPVIMSTSAWLAYQVTKAPWVVVVRDRMVAVDREAPVEPGEAVALVGA